MKSVPRTYNRPEDQQAAEIRGKIVSSNITLPPDLCLDGPLWQFAGRFWSRPGAQETALTLQDRGWSVTDILCSLWMTVQGRRFPGFGTGQVITWREEVTVALRNARKAITKGNRATDQVRDCIARSELEAERVELALAYRVLTHDTGPPDAVVKNTEETLALENLQAAAPEKLMDNETSRLLETLIEELRLFTAGEQQPC